MRKIQILRYVIYAYMLNLGCVRTRKESIQTVYNGSSMFMQTSFMVSYKMLFYSNRQISKDL